MSWFAPLLRACSYHEEDATDDGVQIKWKFSSQINRKTQIKNDSFRNSPRLMQMKTFSWKLLTATGVQSLHVVWNFAQSGQSHQVENKGLMWRLQNWQKYRRNGSTLVLNDVVKHYELSTFTFTSFVCPYPIDRVVNTLLNTWKSSEWFFSQDTHHQINNALQRHKP